MALGNGDFPVEQKSHDFAGVAAME